MHSINQWRSCFSILTCVAALTNSLAFNTRQSTHTIQSKHPVAWVRFIDKFASQLQHRAAMPRNAKMPKT
jgi:hypothetical protein